MHRPLEQTPRPAPGCAWRVLISACLLFDLSACGEDEEERAEAAAVVPGEKERERAKREQEKREREKREQEKREQEKREQEKREQEKREQEKREKQEREKQEREAREREEQAKTPRFSIGGQLSGLASGRNITLRTNSGEELPVNANGAFRFKKLLISGEAYQVEISRQPFWQFCEVQQGQGQAMSSISSVKVLCSDAVAEVTTLAGSGKAGFADGQRLAASFNTPGLVTIDVHGNVYVADYINHRIRKITPEGKVSTLAGSGVAGFADGQGAEASFRSPVGVAVDHEGHVYVADNRNHRIRKITPTGKVTTMAGSGNSDFEDGVGVQSSFRYPAGVAVDHEGHVYVADNWNHRIRKITPTGKVTTMAGSGNAAFEDGMGVQSSFRYPAGVAVDHEGHVYVADSDNHRIRKITPTGKVTTMAGSGNAAFEDGMGVQSSFRYPAGVAVDHEGHVFVADNSNRRIRKITPAGEVTTLAGSGQPGGLDGQGAMASFKSPYGVAVGQEGNLYVADTSNHLIRKISPVKAR